MRQRSTPVDPNMQISDQAQIGIQLPSESIEQASISTIVTTHSPEGLADRADVFDGNQSNDDTIAIQFQKRGTTYCNEECDCICHLRSRHWWRSPAVIKNIVGFLFLHYTSLSILEPACTTPSCRNYSTRILKITFCLPKWFLLKAAHFAAKISPHGDPTAGLTIQRRTPEFATDSIYHLSERNNIAGLQHILRSRMASPNDADDLNGCTSLHGRRKTGHTPTV